MAKILTDEAIRRALQYAIGDREAFLDTLPNHKNPDTIGPPYERDIAFLTLMVAIKEGK